MGSQLFTDVIIGKPHIFISQILGVNAGVVFTGDFQLFNLLGCTTAEYIKVGVIGTGEWMDIFPPTQDDFVDNEISGKLISNLGFQIRTVDSVWITILPK